MENYKAREIYGLEPQTTQVKHTMLNETANPNRQCKTHTFIYIFQKAIHSLCIYEFSKTIYITFILGLGESEGGGVQATDMVAVTSVCLHLGGHPNLQFTTV